MRWLEKVYRKISDGFQRELTTRHGLSGEEIEICLSIATEDLAQGVKLKPVPQASEQIKKGEAG